jgi:hypothetical protein
MFGWSNKAKKQPGVWGRGINSFMSIPGARGMVRRGTEGAMSTFGFYKVKGAVPASGGLVAASKWRFLGRGGPGLEGQTLSQMGKLGIFMKGLPMVFLAGSIAHGFQQEGLYGGIKAAARNTAEFAAFSMVPMPVLAIAGLGYGAYKGVQAIARRGREATMTEFTGNTYAINTQAAYTMRQRALQEISRSHTNARTLLGNEAQFMHI